MGKPIHLQKLFYLKSRSRDPSHAPKQAWPGSRNLTASLARLCSGLRHWFRNVILHLIFGWELPISALNFGFLG